MINTYTNQPRKLQKISSIIKDNEYKQTNNFVRPSEHFAEEINIKKEPAFLSKLLLLERATGFEPATFSLGS